MDKLQAEKILTNILETLGLQDDRAKTVLALMYSLGFSYQDAISFTKSVTELEQPVVDIKYLEDLDTTRQRIAFREWFTAKEQKAAPLNFVYDMFLEHIKVKNELQIQIDQLNAERSRVIAWTNKLADKISAVTGVDINIDDGRDSWAVAIDALDEYATRTRKPQLPSFNIPPTIEAPVIAFAKESKPKAWYYIRMDGTNGISANIDIAKQSAGTDGSVFGLWPQDAFKDELDYPASAWWAYQTEVSYLIRDLPSGAKRYPNVVEWIPLYLQKESYEMLQQNGK